MLRALSVLEEQTENQKLAKVLGQVRGDVEAGIALSDALEKHPKSLLAAVRQHGAGR